MIDSLSLYYGISGKTTFEKLKKLVQEKQLNRQGALQLTQVLETALNFRAITHLHYGTEEESVAYQAHEEKRLPHEAATYVLTPTEREELLSLYQILLPLEFTLRVFVSSRGKNNPFKQGLLHTKTGLAKNPALQHHLAARSYERLFSPEKALGSYRQALRLDPDNVEIHLHYVSYVHSLREMQQRSQAAYEATAVSHAKQLATHLLTLQSKQLLTPSGFDPYYEALPVAWRPTFSATLDKHNPVHRHLLERLDRIDSVSKEELEKAHKSANAYIAAKAEILLSSQKEEVKNASAPSHKTASTAADWARLSAALKSPTHATEEHAILLTYSFSLLSRLIHNDANQVEDYAQEIEKSLTKIIHVLLMPAKNGTRDSASLLIFYRRLPCEIRPAFRRTVLAYQEKITQSNVQKIQKQNQIDLDFFTTLLKTLNEEPDEAGQRESWQQHKRAWQDTLQNLVEPESAGKNKICLVSPLLDKEGKQAISRPLKTSIQQALLDEALEFRHNKISGSEHHVVRLSIKRADGTAEELYCKAYPEMPGMTYLIERLHHRLIGHGTCFSELVKIERPGKSPIPVLVSEGIPGPTLHDVLKKNPQRLQQLDHQTYSDLVLLAILTNPEDGLPTNYIVTPKVAGSSVLILVSVDHDHALFPPYLLEPAKAKSPETKQSAENDEDRDPAEEKQSLRPKLQVKTILFCLDAMQKPIDSASRDAFLRLNPAKVIASVLREAQVQNDYYGQLFDPTLLKTFHENRSTKPNVLKGAVKHEAENCTIPIPLKEGDAIKMYQKLNRLQQFLTDHPQATLLQCLLHTEPRVGMAYARALDDYFAPLDRLLHLGEYPVNLQGQMVTSTHAIKSLRLQTQQIGAEQYADLKDLTPAQGLAELDLMTYQQDTLDSIREEIMREDFRRFLVLKAPEHKAAVISGTDHKSEGIDWHRLDETKQRGLLNTLQGIAFTRLNLSGCNVLTKEQLIQLLIQSPDCIALDLSGHPLLDDLWLLEISRNARHLKELTIRQAPRLENIRNTAAFQHLNSLDIADNPALRTINIQAPQLKLLQAKNCYKLHTLKTASQQLREVDVSGNRALLLTKELAHEHSTYVLNRLKLSGCTKMKATAVSALSACPIFLWTPLVEAAQIKVAALLERYIGQEGWQSFSLEQRKQASARFILFEYEQSQEQAETLKLLLKKAKSQEDSAKETFKHTPVVAALRISNSRLQQGINTSRIEIKSEEDHVPQVSQQTSVAAPLLMPDPELQGRIDAALALAKERYEQRDVGIKHNRYSGSGTTYIGRGLQIKHDVYRAPTFEDPVRQAQESLTKLVPHTSAFQLQEIVNLALKGVKDEDYGIRRAAHQTLAAITTLTSHTSVFQLQIIANTTFAGMKDKNNNIQEAVRQMLAALIALVPHASASQLHGIVSATFAGIKDKDNEVQKAIRQILAAVAALAPHASASQLQGVLGVTLAEVKNIDKDIRQVSQQTLAALVPHASASQFQEIFDTLLTWVEDKDWHVREAVQQILVLLAPHTSASQLQEIVGVALAGGKDEKEHVREAAQQTFAGVISHVSASQLQEISDAALVGMKDEHSTVRGAAQQTLAILASRISTAQPQGMADAVFAGVKDKERNVRKAAQQTLTALAPHASPSQLLEIINAALMGVRDKERDVRKAAQETLTALVPRLSASQLEGIINAALAGVRDKDEMVQNAAQKTLAALTLHAPTVLIPRVSAGQLQGIIDAALIWGKDVDRNLREIAQKTFALLVPHAAVSQLQKIIDTALTRMKDKEEHIQKAAQETLAALVPRLTAPQIQNILRSDEVGVQTAIHTGLIQHAKKVTLDQLPTYCKWVNESMRGSRDVQLMMLSGIPIVQQRIGLETYLSTLQAERQATQTPTWLTIGSIYEQLEAQVIDFYVPDRLQNSVKAYEGATQTALQTLENCKATMEAMVAPELKSHQQQFLETQAALFEQYHATEQQRIAAFQTHIANQAEALTSETLAEAQTQFAKEQADAKATFQAEIQAFYEQAGDQLNGETKLDVSELLQKRRAFLEVQLEQREVQSREQQTLLIQWQQALRDQARELQEPQEEFKAEPPTTPATQKALPQTSDQINQLQQALQMLQARVDTIDQSNRALQEQTLADQQALQLQRRQLEVLLRERQQAQQIIEAIAAIQAQPALRNFYHCIKVKLGDCFVACKMFAAGAIAPPLSTGVSVVTQGISLAGKLLPIPYAALISSGIVEGIQYLAKRDGTQRAKHVSTLVGDLIEMDQLAEKIARLLTWRYELQIQQLTHESAILLAESAVAYMMEGLRTKGAIDPQKPLAEQMIQAIYEDYRLVKLPHLFKTKLTTCSGKTDWTASSVLFKSGIALWDKESLTFSFYAQKLHKDPSKKANHELGSKPEKYGYRLGSLQEVTRLDLRRRADVPADISTAFTSSIGLRFMDVSSKQRVVRMEMPVLLPLSSQSTAAASSTPSEEKEQQPHRPPTPRPSRADTRVDQEGNDGSGAPAALHKTKKQVRFSDNIHIIFPKPYASEEDDVSRETQAHSLEDIVLVLDKIP